MEVSRAHPVKGRQECVHKGYHKPPEAESWRIPALFTHNRPFAPGSTTQRGRHLPTHTLQHKLIYFEEIGSGWLTPRLTSPPQGRSLWIASGEGRLHLRPLGIWTPGFPHHSPRRRAALLQASLKSSSSSCRRTRANSNQLPPWHLLVFQSISFLAQRDWTNAHTSSSTASGAQPIRNDNAAR